MLKHPCSESCSKSNKIKINIVSYVRYKLSKTTFVVLLRQQKVLQIKDHLKSLFSQKQGREGGRFLYTQTKTRRQEQGGEGGRGATGEGGVVLRRVIILITFMSANRNFVNSIVILLMTIIIKILMIIVKSMMVNPIARNILNIAKKKVHKKWIWEV